MNQIEGPTHFKIPRHFVEFITSSHEEDIITSCHYFFKNGVKPVKNLPIHEVCFGIGEISTFVDCFIANMSRLKNLKKLSMHWNILSYQDLENDYNKLHSQVGKLGNALKKIRSLEHLVFKISRNHPKSLLCVFKNIVRSKQIKKLAFELQASKFQKGDILRITSLLKQSLNIQELFLSFKRCLVSDDAFTELFECLYELKTLRKLKINFTFTHNLMESQIENIIKLPLKLSRLECLWVDISGTDIEDRFVKRMAEAFSGPNTKQSDDRIGLCRRVSFFVTSQTKMVA